MESGTKDRLLMDLVSISLVTLTMRECLNSEETKLMTMVSMDWWCTRQPMNPLLLRLNTIKSLTMVRLTKTWKVDSMLEELLSMEEQRLPMSTSSRTRSPLKKMVMSPINASGTVI